MTIMQIQCLLTYLGYSPGTIDGADGRNTQAAIRAFQADYGLTVDGIPGAATQKMLIGAIAGTAVKVEKPESSDAPKTGTFRDVLGRHQVLHPKGIPMPLRPVRRVPGGAAGVHGTHCGRNQAAAGYPNFYRGRRRLRRPVRGAQCGGRRRGQFSASVWACR